MSESREARNLAFRRLLTRLENHNPARKGHGERVASYSVAVGYEMGLRDEEQNASSRLYMLRWAAALHDVWKLEVSSDLLERPGPLSPDEQSALRRGPLIFEAESGLPILEDLLLIIGRQYAPPGEESPLESRIILVCTAFDAMTSLQPWRAARTEEDALSELGSSPQFDHAVVRAFLKIQPLIQPVKSV